MDKQTCPVMENHGKPLIDVDDVSFSNGGRPNEQSHTWSWTVSTSVECGCHPCCVVWGKNLGPMMLQINGEMNIQEEELFWCEQYDMVLTYPQFRVSSGAPQNRPKWSLEPGIQYPGAGGRSCLRKLGCHLESHSITMASFPLITGTEVLSHHVADSSPLMGLLLQSDFSFWWSLIHIGLSVILHQLHQGAILL